MAGDWMKVEHATPDKPEVFEIAQGLGMDPDAVFTKCFRVWSWFDVHTEEGNAPVTVEALLNRLAGCDKFVAEMEKVGWMRREKGRLLLPNFDRHTGETAKKRSLNAKRQAAFRERNAPSVTNSVTREEKRRSKNTTSGSDAPDLCAVEFDRARKHDTLSPNDNRQTAWKAWKARIREGVDATMLADQWIAYRDTCEGDRKHIKHQATFYGPDRHWEMDYSPRQRVPDDIDGVRELAARHPDIDVGEMHWREARKVLANRLGMEA